MSCYKSSSCFWINLLMDIELKIIKLNTNWWIVLESWLINSWHMNLLIEIENIFTGEYNFLLKSFYADIIGSIKPL